MVVAEVLEVLVAEREQGALVVHPQIRRNRHRGRTVAASEAEQREEPQRDRSAESANKKA